jgi:replicative DNA helicase
MSDRKSMEDIHFPDRQPKAEPPHNLGAEAAVLGAVLFDNIAYERTQEILRFDDFYTPVHQEIYRAMEVRIQNGLVANGVTMREYFETEGKLADIGGAKYLEQLMDSAAFGPEIRDYSAIIRHNAARRAIIEAGEYLQATAQDPKESESASALIERARERLQGVEDMRLRGSQWKSAAEAVLPVVVELEDRLNNGRGSEVAGLKTGIDDLDKAIGGLRKGNLIILAGRPGMAKSGIAGNIAANVAGDQVPGGAGEKQVVGFFSLEMENRELGTRLSTQMAHKTGIGRVEYQDAINGSLGQNQFAIIAAGARAIPETLVLDETPYLSAADIGARARALKRSAGRLDLIVIDYLQIMNYQIQKGENLSSAIGRTTSALKRLAKELGVPIVALSQLSRNCEQRDNKRPILSDLRESGSIEQDADVVLFVYRDAYYHEAKEPPHGAKDSAAAVKWAEWWSELKAVENKAEIHAAKVRMAKGGRIIAHYDLGSDALVNSEKELTVEGDMYS